MSARSHSVLPAPARRMLSRVEAAAYVGLGVTKFDELRADGLMPDPVRYGGRVLWDVRSLDAAIDDIQPPESGRKDASPVNNPWDKYL